MVVLSLKNGDAAWPRLLSTLIGLSIVAGGSAAFEFLKQLALGLERLASVRFEAGTLSRSHSRSEKSKTVCVFRCSLAAGRL